MPTRNFRQVEQELEQSVAKLKETKDPDSRREVLRRMRLLLMEADSLLLETTPLDTVA